MNANLFFQLLVNGFAIGMLYVLIVLGMDMILKGTKILNFAHGQIYMLGGYFFYLTFSTFRLNPFMAIFLSGLFSLILGVLSYLGVFGLIQRRFTSQTTLSYRLLMSAMASVGLMMILQQGTLLVFGTKEKGIISVFPQLLDFWGLRLPLERVMVILVAFILCLLLYLLFFKTRLGKAMRAVSFDAEMSSLLGVNTFWVFIMSFGIGCALAGIAGAIIAPIFSVNPNMGNGIIATALMVMVVGGIGSYKGAIIGGIVVGQVLSFGYQFFGGISQPLLFTFVILLLILRPGGLFGEVHQ
jgi:branched-chain amino acid transport system permease protein